MSAPLKSRKMNGYVQNGITEVETHEIQKRTEDDVQEQHDIEEYSHHWTGLIATVFRAILDKLNPVVAEEARVISFVQPEELMKQFDLTLKDTDPGLDSEDFTKLVDEIVDRSVKTTNALFRNQLFGGMDAYGLAAAILGEALNTSVYTYDVAPVFSLMEREVVQKLCSMCGIEDGDGISCPGGSITNMYGLNLARYHYDNTVKTKGMSGQKKQLIFASAQAHYSIPKGAAFMGFGIDAVVLVECDEKGSMIPEKLREKIEEALKDDTCVPLIVLCTSGTTVLNGFDPIDKLADICEEYKIWLHVDGASGGGLILSKKYREIYFKGVHRADSITWNWHKLPGAPQQTSMFLTKHKGLLKQAHCASATYLFHSEKHYDTSFDAGDGSIQCGRKPDAVKIWVMWRGRGLDELERRIDDTCDVADYMAARLRDHPRFRLVMPEAQASCVCFWVVPPRIARNYKKDSDEYWTEIDKVALKLKTRMVKQGLAMITYQPLPDKNLPNFFRVTLTCHPPFTRKHVESAIDIMVSLSDEL